MTPLCWATRRSLSSFGSRLTAKSSPGLVGHSSAMIQGLARTCQQACLEPSGGAPLGPWPGLRTPTSSSTKSSGSTQSTACGTLSSACEQSNSPTAHTLALPEIALEEHLAHYRHAVEDADRRRRAATKDLRRL